MGSCNGSFHLDVFLVKVPRATYVPSELQHYCIYYINIVHGNLFLNRATYCMYGIFP